jgi:hypothetical protein
MTLPNQQALARTRDTEHRRNGPSKQNRQEQLADVTAKRRQLLETHRAKMAARHAVVQEPAEEHETLAASLERDA